MKGRNKEVIILLFILYIILASSGLVLFKLGSENATIHWQLFEFQINFSIKTVLGILCYGFSFLIWLYIVSQMNLTVAMPLSVALVNTLVVIESCLFLKEKLSLTQCVGIFVIVIGVFLITFKK